MYKNQRFRDMSCCGAKQEPSTKLCFDRRSFNVSSTTAIIASLLDAGPANAAATLLEQPDQVYEPIKMVLRVNALRGSLPQSWITDFSAAMEGYGYVAVSQKPLLRDIIADLRGTKKSPPTTVDCITLGDTWLSTAIQEGLIRPIDDAEQHRWWHRLSPIWRHLVMRDGHGSPHSSGPKYVWGAPYRFGCALIVSRSARLKKRGGRVVSDWIDLLQPQLKGRVAFVDSSRDFVGVAFKTLGLGFNTDPIELRACNITESTIIRRVEELAAQVKVFGSVDSSRALAAEEVDAVVGWSDDALPMAERGHDLHVAAPASGSSLWADLWCVPKGAAGGFEQGVPSPLLPAWFELPLVPAKMQAGRGLRGGASPLLLPPTAGMRAIQYSKRYSQPAHIYEDPSGSLRNGVMPSMNVLERSEFLLPLSDDTQELYRRCLKNIL